MPLERLGHERESNMRTYAGVKFIDRVPGPINTETVLLIPGSRWVITSSLTDPEQQKGKLYAINADDLEVITVYPDGANASDGHTEFDRSLLAHGPGQL